MWDTAWWEDHWTTDWIIRVAGSDGFTEFYNLMATDAKLPIIIAFSYGEYARESEKLSDCNIADRAMTAMATALPPGQLQPRNPRPVVPAHVLVCHLWACKLYLIAICSGLTD